MSRAALTVSVAPARSAFLDAARGVAIVLMMADHAVLAFGGPWGVREILGRFAAPLFMAIAGYLWRPRLSGRILEVGIAAALSVPLVSGIGGAHVPILVVFLLVYPALWVSYRWPYLVLGLAVLQLSAWPVPWYGYQPGFVLAFLVLGQLLARHATVPVMVGSGGVLGWLGRWPLTAYIGHLALIYAGMRL